MLDEFRIILDQAKQGLRCTAEDLEAYTAHTLSNSDEHGLSTLGVKAVILPHSSTQTQPTRQP